MLIDIPARVRWPDVIDALAAAGCTNAELARLVGVERSTILNIRRSGQPSFATGISILRVFVLRMQQ